MKVEDLKNQLILISKNSPVTHKEIAEKVGISISYSVRLRNKNHKPIENEETVNLYKELIKAYRSEIRSYLKDLEKLL